MSNHKDLTVVALGASAGGYEALQIFVSNINTEETYDIAYVITQHLDPAQPTMLLNLLSRHVKLPIIMITEGMKIETNTISTRTCWSYFFFCIICICSHFISSRN